MFWIDEAQDGVVSRRQLHAAGLGAKAIERLLRRRELAVVHPGVYLNHTGEPSWRQRAWAALLLCDPVLGLDPSGQSRRSDFSPRATQQVPGRAALAGPSALRISLDPAGFIGPNLRAVLGDDRIHLAIERDRRIRAPELVVLHRTSHLVARARWSLAPPRIQLDEALLDVAFVAVDPLQAVGLLADACQARLTTPVRLRAVIEGRERVPGRAFLIGVLGDLADGTCSALEHGYHSRVARPHGLPPGTQQVREATRLGLVFRDLVVGELVVELDGRLFHDNARQRDRDFARDLETAAAGRRTVRLSWGQVYRHPCATAARLAEVLRASGWSGTPSPCRRTDCVVTGSR